MAVRLARAGTWKNAEDVILNFTPKSGIGEWFMSMHSAPRYRCSFAICRISAKVLTDNLGQRVEDKSFVRFNWQRDGIVGWADVNSG